MPINAAIVVPCYNHGATLQTLFEALAPMGVPLFLVDDASDAVNRERIDAAVERFDFVRLVRRSENGGKGAAVIDGLKAAHAAGFTHAIQIDADGQHDPNDAARLLEESRAHPSSLISGRPVYDDSVPKGRLIGRYITHFWVWAETLSTTIADSMCGLRVYPLAPVIDLISRVQLGLRMDFDIEILVRLYWQGVDMRFVPVKVIYPENGISHFDVLRDNIRISKMHTRLFLSSIPRWPSLIARSRGTHWSALSERRGELGMRFLFGLYGLLGRRAFSIAVSPVVLVFWMSASVQRKASAEYLERLSAFARANGVTIDGSLSTLRHFRAFAESVLDKLAAWRGDIRLGREALFEDEESRRVLTHARDEKGKVVLVSHLGTVEALRAIAEMSGEVVINALVFDAHAPRFKAVMERLAPGSRLNLIAVNEIGIETAAMLSEKIERGEWVAIAADRTPVTQGAREVRTVSVPFLGENAPFPTGAYHLASVLGAPVCTLFACREGLVIRIRAREFAQQLTINRRHRLDDLTQCARRYAAELEAQALRHPLQWFNFFDFWHQ